MNDQDYLKQLVNAKLVQQFCPRSASWANKKMVEAKRGTGLQYITVRTFCEFHGIDPIIFKPAPKK